MQPTPTLFAEGRQPLWWLVLMLSFVSCSYPPKRAAVPPKLTVSLEEWSTFARHMVVRPGANPGVDIYEDGRCEVRPSDRPEHWVQLSRTQVKQLLAFFNRQGLFEISEAKIEAAIRRELQPVIIRLPDGSSRGYGRMRVAVTDAGYTRLSARRGTNYVDITRYALGMEVEEYRTVTELQTIQRCIQKIHETIHESEF